jgi:hypothetical protein
MKNYKQINQEQRYQIFGLLKAGLRQSEIATEICICIYVARNHTISPLRGAPEELLH